MAIPPHALAWVLPPVTCTLKLDEELLPGLGLVTLTPYVPPEEIVPAAVNCVEETKVVVRGVPPSHAWAPLTKLLPLRVRLIAPAANVVGVTDARTGTGFHNVTLLDPATLELAALIAPTVTMFEPGMLAGAVYIPDEVIVPEAALPPATPFTCHATD